MSKSFEGATLEMELTPDMEKVVRDNFNIEIEMLQGTREELASGKIKFNVFIADEQKANMIKEFVLKLISNSHKTNLN